MQALIRSAFSSDEEFAAAKAAAKAAAMAGESFEAPAVTKTVKSVTVVIPDESRPGRPCVYHNTASGKQGSHTTRAAIRECAAAHDFKAVWMRGYVA